MIIIVVLGGYWLWMNMSAPAAPATDTQTQNVTQQGNDTGTQNTDTAAPSTSDTSQVAPVVIGYTSAGFDPATVTIKKGQTVRFVNNDVSVAVWPASAVHPTHSVYPQKSKTDCLGSSFDACHGLNHGGSRDFTFDYVGTWGFHNHLSPSKTGKIIVTP